MCALERKHPLPPLQFLCTYSTHLLPCYLTVIVVRSDPRICDLTKTSGLILPEIEEKAVSGFFSTTTLTTWSYFMGQRSLECPNRSVSRSPSLTNDGICLLLDRPPLTRRPSVSLMHFGQCQELSHHSSFIPIVLQLVGTESGWKRRPGRGLTRAIKMNLTRSCLIEL